jgi:hypothetical protein
VRHRMVGSLLSSALVLVAAIGGFATKAAATPIRRPAGCGVWTPVPTPSLGDTSVLEDVAVVNRDLAWAVGNKYHAPVTSTLVEEWDGSSWTVVPSPNPEPDWNELDAVDAVSPDDAWAVGVAYPDAYRTPVAEHWDGASWTAADVPAPWPAKLRDVAAIAGDDVWAVGSFQPPDDISFPLTEHWDGSAWTIVGAPLGDGPTVLTGVAAVSATDIWAVGYTYTQDGFYPQHPVTEHWDGTAWSIVPSPTPGSSAELDGISVDGARVWAIGTSDVGTFALGWEGSTWGVSPVAADALTTGERDLVAIGGRVWAVGSRYDAHGMSRATALVRAGGRWRHSPDRSAAGTDFRGIDAASPAQLWAVGSDGALGTLAAEFVPCGGGA